MRTHRSGYFKPGAPLVVELLGLPLRLALAVVLQQLRGAAAVQLLLPRLRLLLPLLQERLWCAWGVRVGGLRAGA